MDCLLHQSCGVMRSRVVEEVAFSLFSFLRQTREYVVKHPPVASHAEESTKNRKEDHQPDRPSTHEPPIPPWPFLPFWAAGE